MAKRTETIAAMAAITPGERGLEFERLVGRKDDREERTKSGKRGQPWAIRTNKTIGSEEGAGREGEEREAHSSESLDEDWKGESTAVSLGAAESSTDLVPEGWVTGTPYSVPSESRSGEGTKQKTKEEEGQLREGCAPLERDETRRSYDGKRKQ